MRRVVGAVLVVVVAGLWNHAGDWFLRPLAGSETPVLGGKPPAAPAMPPSPVLPVSFRIDPLDFLSTAPADSLEFLPGIGPVIAGHIVEARRSRGAFASWSDLRIVKGIGPRTVQRLRSLSGQ